MSDLWQSDLDRIAQNSATLPQRNDTRRLISDWAKGYAAAFDDLRHLAAAREIMSVPLAELIDDLQQDARVIDHEVANREQRRRLAAQRESKQEELLL